MDVNFLEKEWVFTVKFWVFKKYKLYLAKKNWIFEKAAPIPGGNRKLSIGFVKKHKKFYKNTFLAYKVFKTY